MGEDVEVVGGLGRRIGSKDGASAGGEVECNCTTNAFCCTAVESRLGGGFLCVEGLRRRKVDSSKVLKK
jgi:hypothetical protein